MALDLQKPNSRLTRADFSDIEPFESLLKNIARGRKEGRVAHLESLLEPLVKLVEIYRDRRTSPTKLKPESEIARLINEFEHARDQQLAISLQRVELVGAAQKSVRRRLHSKQTLNYLDTQFRSLKRKLIALNLYTPETQIPTIPKTKQLHKTSRIRPTQLAITKARQLPERNLNQEAQDLLEKDIDIIEKFDTEFVRTGYGAKPDQAIKRLKAWITDESAAMRSELKEQKDLLNTEPGNFLLDLLNKRFKADRANIVLINAYKLLFIEHRYAVGETDFNSLEAARRDYASYINLVNSRSETQKLYSTIPNVLRAVEKYHGINMFEASSRANETAIRDSIQTGHLEFHDHFPPKL